MRITESALLNQCR